MTLPPARGKTVHLQHREKHLIDLLLIHVMGRDNGDLALDAGINDEILARELGHRTDERGDVGILHIEGHGLGGTDVPRRHDAGEQHGGGAQQMQTAIEPGWEAVVLGINSGVLLLFVWGLLCRCELNIHVFHRSPVVRTCW